MHPKGLFREVRVAGFAPARARSALAAAAVALLIAGPGWAKAPSSSGPDCKHLPCASVLPGATSFVPKAGGRYVAGLDAGGKVIGWVVRSTDVIDVRAYSGKPLVTLLGLDREGVIRGVKVLEHSEPILLVGIPEQALFDFAAKYVGRHATDKVVVGSSPDPKAFTVDVISGATVTSLAQNKTILDASRALGEAAGIIEARARTRGEWVREDKPWSWARMAREGVFGRLHVTEEQMGTAGDGVFIDLHFTIADPPQIGLALLGPSNYAWLQKRLHRGDHLLAVLGDGSSSFKGSGFVRGGIFDRVKLEQGLRSVMFRDHDYVNLSHLAAPDAPEFKEGAVFIVRGGALDPGAPFALVFTGSRYNGKGAFSREFHAFSATHTLPASVYRVERAAAAPGDGGEIWRQAWYNRRFHVALVVLFVLVIAGLFTARRFLTGSMTRLRRLHPTMLAISFVVLGLWLHAQPSVTQVLTAIDSVVHEWRWGLFLTEPLLFVSWTFIAAIALVWGRGVFCGWVCPYGALNELLFKLGRLLHLPNLELPDRVHLRLRWLRYGILAVLIGAYLYSPALGERLAEVEPFKTTFFVVPWLRHWTFLAWWVVLLLWALFTYRPFCRYICPLGAALAIPSSLRFSGPRRRNFCSGCKICTRGCEPRAIRPDGTIDPRECLSCMECEANYRDEEVCPPLVGLTRLERRAAAGGKAVAPGKLARLRHQAEDRR